MELYYKESGKVGIMGPILMLLLGLIGSVGLGLVYGFITVISPFIYVNFFITLILGFCVGKLIGVGAKLGKVRNDKVIGLFSLVFGVIAAYMNWIGWFLSQFSDVQLADLWITFDPMGLFYNISIVAEEGAWSIFGYVPTGFVLYGIWIIEALIIIILTCIGSEFDKDIAFCEDCRNWMEKPQKIDILTPITDVSNFITKLEHGDFTPITSLKKAKPDDMSYTTVRIVSCSKCNKQHYLSITSVNITIDSDNDASEEEIDLIDHLILKEDQYKTLNRELPR